MASSGAAVHGTDSARRAQRRDRRAVQRFGRGVEDDEGGVTQHPPDAPRWRAGGAQTERSVHAPVCGAVRTLAGSRPVEQTETALNRVNRHLT